MTQLTCLGTKHGSTTHGLYDDIPPVMDSDRIDPDLIPPPDARCLELALATLGLNFRGTSFDMAICSPSITDRAVARLMLGKTPAPLVEEPLLHLQPNSTTGQIVYQHGEHLSENSLAGYFTKLTVLSELSGIARKAWQRIQDLVGQTHRLDYVPHVLVVTDPLITAAICASAICPRALDNDSGREKFIQQGELHQQVMRWQLHPCEGFTLTIEGGKATALKFHDLESVRDPRALATA